MERNVRTLLYAAPFITQWISAARNTQPAIALNTFEVRMTSLIEDDERSTGIIAGTVPFKHFLDG